MWREAQSHEYEPLEAFGDFPPVLSRVFSEERWARAFVEEGRMRFRLVDYHAQLEDKSGLTLVKANHGY